MIEGVFAYFDLKNTLWNVKDNFLLWTLLLFCIHFAHEKVWKKNIPKYCPKIAKVQYWFEFYSTLDI